MLETKFQKAFASFVFRDFRLFILARLFLTTGAQMLAVSVAWQIFNITKDPFSLGLSGIAEAIPFISVTLFAGHIADRYNRKIIYLISLAVFSLAALLLIYISFYVKLNETGPLPIYLVICLVGLSRGFLAPTSRAMITQLISREYYTNAFAWNINAWQIGSVVGPAIGGILNGYFDAGFCYIVIFILIFSSFIFITLIKYKPIKSASESESLFESLRTGIKFVFNNQLILSAMSLDLFAVLFGGAVSMLPVFASEILKTGAQGLGILKAAPAFGAIMMITLLTFFPINKKAGKKLLYCVAGFGLCMIFFALSEYYYLSLVLLLISGALDSVSIVLRGSILQFVTPQNMLGRVSSVNSVFIGSSNEIGAFESGLAAKLFGLVNSVVIGGTITLGVVAATAKFAPKLRKLDLDDLK